MSVAATFISVIFVVITNQNIWDTFGLSFLLFEPKYQIS